MRTVIRDTDTLMTVQVADLELYLRSFGWQEDRGFDYFNLWKTTDDETGVEIILPKNSEASDYVFRISAALNTLSEIENRSQIEVLMDISHVTDDLIRIRREVPIYSDASISINDGAALVENARQLLFSAACSVVESKRAFSTRRPDQASDYMNRVRMGQTERGSYIVTLLSSVIPLLNPGKDSYIGELEESFPRRVTKLLNIALDTVSKASQEADRTGSFAMFEENVELGVSANLCEAIANMSKGESGSQKISITTKWAPKSPLEEEISSATEFSARSIPILEDAARRLRELEPLEGEIIVGPVINLHRDPNSTLGVATIACIIEGSPRKVRASLSEEDYQTAINAHRDGDAITFEANIIREGRGTYAQDVRRLRVLRDE